MEAGTISLLGDFEKMADGYRSICLEMERSTTVLRELVASTGSLGNKRVLNQLDQCEGLRLPTLLLGEGLSVEDQPGSSELSVSMPLLAEPTLVPNTIGAGMRCSDRLQPEARPVDISERGPSSIVPESLIPVDRLDVIRNRFRNDGLSEKVIKTIIAGSRASTIAVYQSTWPSWKNWCLRFNHNPLSGEISTILQFLTDSLEEGKSYSSINVYRSILSITLDPVDGHTIGSHPYVTGLMRGIYNINPPKEKYKDTWDVNLVLNHLQSLNNDELTKGPLSRKRASK